MRFSLNPLSPDPLADARIRLRNKLDRLIAEELRRDAPARIILAALVVAGRRLHAKASKEDLQPVDRSIGGHVVAAEPTVPPASGRAAL